MIRKLHLQGFKNFKDAELSLGNLTLLVGTNASGKSNLRDAFRFLHGIARGYTLAEILGEKWVEGGVLQWKGIRGGTREATYLGQDSFALSVTIEKSGGEVRSEYEIEVAVPSHSWRPRVAKESLRRFYPQPSELQPLFFETQPVQAPESQRDRGHVSVQMQVLGSDWRECPRAEFNAYQPVLSQMADNRKAPRPCKVSAAKILDSLRSMRFLDLAPDAMRVPSLPGQHVLGDRGENLSSVLLEICENAQSRDAILEWIRELTPQDVVDFEFVPDQTGKILASLVESGGARTSLYSASDGTLRFLAIIAALLGPDPARLYFFEELENGVHPTRLHLLLQLIEQQVSGTEVQVVATTHSPQLLGFLSEQARESASLVYRPSDRPDARIRRILDIPEARRVLEQHDLARLHASGWLENAVAFSEAEEAPA
jgi:predicted ATPase